MLQRVQCPERSEAPVSILKRLLGFKNSEPPARIRVCVECGMPISEHKEWCSIFRIKQAMERKRVAAASQG